MKATLQTPLEFSKRFYSNKKDVKTHQEKWKDESKLEDIVKEYYTSSEQKEYIVEDSEFLKKNRIFTLEDWRKLTEADKDKDGYPRGLRMLLDESMKCNFE
jgi:hypothetical protein